MKTLKDLLREVSGSYSDVKEPNGFAGYFVEANSLKQEAIKDIKFFIDSYNLRLEQLPQDIGLKEGSGKKVFGYVNNMKDADNELIRSGLAIIAYVMWKFNIKKEDLN